MAQNQTPPETGRTRHCNFQAMNTCHLLSYKLQCDRYIIRVSIYRWHMMTKDQICQTTTTQFIQDNVHDSAKTRASLTEGTAESLNPTWIRLTNTFSSEFTDRTEGIWRYKPSVV